MFKNRGSPNTGLESDATKNTHNKKKLNQFLQLSTFGWI